jgi:hypothetical protein
VEQLKKLDKYTKVVESERARQRARQRAYGLLAREFHDVFRSYYLQELAKEEILNEHE